MYTSELALPKFLSEIVTVIARMYPQNRWGKFQFGIMLLLSVTLLVTLVVHMLAYGLVYGLGVTLMWFLHEMGHVLAALFLGIAIRWVFLIPFVGALMRLGDHALRKPETEAIVGIAGPFSGFIATLVAYIIFAMYFEGASEGSDMLITNILFLSCAYNMIQMVITSRPFDGGRFLQIVHPAFRRYLPFPVLAYLSYFFQGAWVLIFWALCLTDRRFTHPWNRVFLIMVLFLAMIIGIALGYGRTITLWEDVPWAHALLLSAANGSDVLMMILALAWSIGAARMSPKPIHATPIWRSVVLTKKVTRSWRDRQGERRLEEQPIEGDDQRSASSEDRRIHAGVFVPDDALPQPDLPYEDMRGQHFDRREVSLICGMFYVTLLCALGTLAYLIGW